MDDYPIFHEPEVDLVYFAKVLATAGSPALPEAAGVYNRLVNNGVSPLVFLGFFKVESLLGTVGIVKEYDTKNPGNVRSPEEPAASLGVVNTPRGPFAKYATWTLGTYDWCKRMLGPKYRGAGLTTVRRVVPKYAPQADGNVPAAYIDSVLSFIEAHEKEGPVSGDPRAKFTDYQHFLPEAMVNNPAVVSRGGSPSWITVHEVDNLSATGGTARATRNYVLNGGGQNVTEDGLKTGRPLNPADPNVGVSFHAVVGDKESFQLLPWNAAAYHAGDGGGDGNYDSIGIETQQVGDFRKTVANLAKLVANLMKEFGLPITRVVQHNHWSGKNCPQYLRAGRLPISNAPGITWSQFIDMVLAERSNLDHVATGNEVRTGVLEDGRPYVQVVFAGNTPRVLGADVQDLGISVDSATEAGLILDQSVQGNTFQGWRERR